MTPHEQGGLDRQIEVRPIAELTLYDGNPKQHPESQLLLIERSIREFGWTTPVLVDKGDVVIAGHGRIEAAKRLGMEQVPTIRLESLTPEQARAYRIADNRLTELGPWDTGKLVGELEALKLEGYDIDLTGYSLTDLGKMRPPDGDGDKVPDPPAEPVTKPGDLWMLGRHRLICGDSTDADTVARALDGKRPKLMVTDPPYGVEYDAEWRNRALRSDGSSIGGRAVGTVSNDDRADWSAAWALSPANVAYCWCPAGADFTEHDRALREAGFEPRMTIIWAKNLAPIGRGHYHVKHEPCIYAVRKGANAGWLGDRKQTTLWEIDKPRKSETGHSTQKPVECMERPIRNHEGGVFDPFMGSGTTLIAAHRQERQCFGVELDPGYVDVIVERWQEYTGGKAERVTVP